MLCFIFQPQGTGTVAPGSWVRALLTGNLPASIAENSFHSSAASCSAALIPAISSCHLNSCLPSNSQNSSIHKDHNSAKKKMRVGLLTISDRVRLLVSI
jgi:hypothetical protein